jgi:NTE family protein
MKPVIKNLVFEAAGVRGIAYCEAIKEMESNKLMSDIERAGTSSGTIMALTVSLGYSGQEIENLIGETNFKKFNDGRYLFAGGITRLKKYYGWYRGKNWRNGWDKSSNKKPGMRTLHLSKCTSRDLKIFM